MNYQRAPKWDKNRPIFLKLGFVLSMAFAFMAFNYTSYTKPEIETSYVVIPEDDGEVIPPIMIDRKKVVPPPEPVIIPLDIVEDIPTPDFIEDLPPEPTVKTANKNTNASLPPMILPSEVEQADEIKHSVDKVKETGPVLFAQEMPVYNSCDLSLAEPDRRECTSNKMLGQIYNTLKYPTYAKENGIEGTVIVSFIVDKTGGLNNVEIIRDIGGGCGAAVIKAISTLGTFTPGMQNGRKVSVIYRVPVKFQLN